MSTKNIKITSKQLMFLLVTMRTVIAMITLPSVVSTNVGRDAWLSSIIAALQALVFAWVAYQLIYRYPNCSLIQISQKVLGRYVGTLVGIVYIWFFLHVAAMLLRIFGDFLTTAAMPETPIGVFIFFLALAIGYAVKNGLEVISRVNEILLPVLVFSIVLILLLVAKDADLVNLKPFVERGWGLVLIGAVSPIAWYCDVFALVMIGRNVNQVKEVKRALFGGVIISSLLITMITVAVIGVFGEVEMQYLTFPTFSLAKMISVGDFLERIEALLMAVWIGGIFIKVAVYLYIAIIGMAELMQLKDYKPLVWPTVSIMVPLSLIIFDNIIQLKKFFKPDMWGVYSLTLCSGLAFILLAIGYIRSKIKAV